MKRILTLFIAVIFCMGLSAGLVSCADPSDDDFVGSDGKGFIYYAESGLKFRLPDYFRKRNEQYTDIVFTTPEARFQVQIMPKTDFEDPNFDFDFDFSITVPEYTEFLINLNGWNATGECKYEYDEEKNTASFFVFWRPTPEEEYSYYYFNILKSENAIYCVTMICEESNYENYEPLFREWSTYIKLIEENN